jgi:hypothetical protein
VDSCKVLVLNAILQKGGILIAHIAADIQKQSKTFYLLFIWFQNIA